MVISSLGKVKAAYLYSGPKAHYSNRKILVEHFFMEYFDLIIELF